jgi:integron integrase
VPAEHPQTTSGPKLLDQLSQAVRVRRYSPRTEEAYRSWVLRYVRFHGTRHPDELGAEDVNRFLTHLAVDVGASASTQSQARAALLFLYREVLHRPLEGVGRESEVVRGKIPRKLPTVLTRVEVGQLLRQLRGVQQLVAAVLYGSGLRLSEGLRLRAKDLDLDRRELVVRGGKGGRDRVSVIPGSLVQRLRDQLEVRRALHDRDLADGSGWAVLPDRYARKAPRAGFEFGWQFIFPASTILADQQTGAQGRFHLHATSVQRAVKAASRSLGLAKRVSCHTLRHNAESRIMPSGSL